MIRLRLCFLPRWPHRAAQPLTRSVLAIASLSFAVFGLGCASSTQDIGFGAVQVLVDDRAEVEIVRAAGLELWLGREAAGDDSVREQRPLSQLLEGELTLDRAVQIALLNNRELQAQYEELGISKAQVIQAGLAANPVLLSSARFPNHPPRRAQLDLGLVQNLLDLLVRPARKQLAQVQFERTQLSVAEAVLTQAARAETGWLEVVAATQVAEMRRLIRDSAEASLELALQLQRAGNASELEVARERGLYESARIEQVRADGEVAASRERLNRTLGLWGSQVEWRAPARLPELPEDEVPLERLESHAIEARLDLAALGKTVEARALALGIKKKWRYLLSAGIGVDAEREGDDGWAVGPSLDLELPIFDRGQAALLRLRSELLQAQHRLEALAIEIRSEVRELRDRLVLQMDLAEHYRDVVIPLRERTVQLTQEQYNFMLVGAFDLLLAKQEEYDAYQAYIEAVRDYHLTKSQLKQALGGSLPTDPGILPTDPGILPTDPGILPTDPGRDEGASS